MTRKELRDKIKLAFALDPDREDGNMPNSYFNTAINDALRKVAKDCNMIPVQKTFALRSGQWEYPMDEDMDKISALFFIDDNGAWNSLQYFSLRQFAEGQEPETDLSDTPLYYAYPKYQNAVVHFWANASDVYDYVTESYITEGTIRTLVDSGADFGRTLSNYRIEPGAIVRNVTDGSYGYVKVLNISTAFVKRTGTAGAKTSTTKLVDVDANFSDIYVEEGDIIVVQSANMPESYAYVSQVSATELTYENMQGLRTRIRAGDTYKVGKATEIVLSADVPHPGLRLGVTNRFNVSAEKGTVIGATVYTETRVTGTITGTPAKGDIAICQEGQHGLISAVGDDYLDVDMWIGGMPLDGHTVSVKTCDKYQIETKGLKQRVLMIAPTPDFDDTPGEESMVVQYNKVPESIGDDNDLLELNNSRYEEPLFKCSFWFSARLSGSYKNNPQFIMLLEQDYKSTVLEYADDAFKPPVDKPLTVWGNRRSTNVFGNRYQGPSGTRYKV